MRFMIEEDHYQLVALPFGKQKKTRLGKPKWKGDNLVAILLHCEALVPRTDRDVQVRILDVYGGQEIPQMERGPHRRTYSILNLTWTSRLSSWELRGPESVEPPSSLGNIK